MKSYWFVPVVLLLLLSSNALAQTVHRGPEFLGREVRLTEPERYADGLFPKGPALVCLEGPPERQCYTAPEDFGNSPAVEVVQLDKSTPALFFSVASGGVSGWLVHFALLRPGTRGNLENFLADERVSNQSRHAFWNDSEISDAPIFITADFVWGPDESHYEPHRYTISAYVWKYSSMAEGRYYSLEDRYMTVRKYDLDANEDILAAEKPEMLARLRRVKASESNKRATQ